MNHLYDAQMDWMQHGKYVWRFSLKLFLLSLAGLVHGLLPFTFTSTVSRGVKEIADDLAQRNNT